MQDAATVIEITAAAMQATAAEAPAAVKATAATSGIGRVG